MHDDPIYLLKPVFDRFDGLIHDHGDSLYLLPVDVSIPLVAGNFSGGLPQRQPRLSNRTAIILIRATIPPPPPLPLHFGSVFRSPADDDVQSLTPEPTDHCR